MCGNVTSMRLRSSINSSETLQAKTKRSATEQIQVIKKIKPSNLAMSTDERRFLIKAEPNTRIENGVDVKFSIDDLKAVDQEHWDGVRNYEARNIMRDDMKQGDLCFFYHSNCKEPGISGIAKIVKEGYVDFTAFDPKHPYYDSKSSPENPKWYMVNVQYVRHLKRFISLKELQSYKELTEMPLIKRGRLSVQKLSVEHWDFILELENKIVIAV